MFHSLKSLLSNTLSKHKLASSVEASLICEEVNKTIPTILQKDENQSTYATVFKDGVIMIESQNLYALSALKLYEEAILQRIQEKFPHVRVKKLRFALTRSF